MALRRRLPCARIVRCSPHGRAAMTQTPGDPSTRPSLLLRLRDAADAEAWRTFVTTYAPLVYAACRKHGLQDADAADLTQEVLAQTVRSMRTFEYRPERGRFRDWLWTVTHHRVTHLLRRQRQEQLAQNGAADAALLPAPGGADPAWVADFNAHVLAVALQRIRPLFEAPTWRAFEATWGEGRPASEVA